MSKTRRRRNRRSIRLKGFDYRRPGAYFITICLVKLQTIFGTVTNSEMHLNKFGNVAQCCWKQIPAHFANVELDEYIVMPNHVHGIVVIREMTNVGAPVGAQHAARLLPGSNVPPGSLGAIVRSYKSAVTRRINQIRHTPGGRVWQRNYYEHIIRDEDSFHRIRTYIRSNPSRWETDRNRI